MALSNSQYDSIMRVYNQKQFQNKREQDERVQEVYAKVPMIRVIDDAISTTAVKRARMLLSGEPDAMEKLRRELKSLRDKKAALLLENGFNVVAIYEDCFAGEEEEDFKWIQENYPNLKIYATVHVKMRFVNRKRDEKLLALGQKAAYFTGSNNFVNIIEGGGMYGFSGIIKLCDLMIDAFLNEKDMKKLIQFKGLGCENYETNCK